MAVNNSSSLTYQITNMEFIRSTWNVLKLFFKCDYMRSNENKTNASLGIPMQKKNFHQRTFLTGMACTNEARTNVQQIINNILPSIVNSIQVCDVNCQYCHLRLYIYPLRQRKVIPYVSLLGVYTRSVSHINLTKTTKCDHLNASMSHL